ncbi:DUF2087 domain-containing protein [Agrobacterium salinitolerans]|uniref:DUF2087 domain-containing protein n=1 Tax=Agrobacterium salinitolerans TaxID=1183413 RepID=A0ABY3BTI2_9HYPH|nr:MULTISPECIES: DUF2087 domain-containing protein [Agrobacterium]MCZ7853162.1 DUF2087 domain-containing protein [Agrobacterium salinitolerans]MCZ7891929.1 DUF2087 domain-containing protein [Agrobacterium salinitolerans]MCZ7973049.1 DUF2087 domain-containing protein [Agrobacterium salinitolerans]TRA94022.1 DUF2087 domain-containing protein [Agrobacterium salinitolerans]
MPRSILSIDIADLSTFAKSVREQIGRLDRKPSHVEMLNLLSRAAGFRNFQHLRASRNPSAESGQSRPEMLSAANEGRVLKTVRVFDAAGRMMQWPARRSHQELCLWYLWAKIPAGQSFSEREFNSFLDSLHLFGDAAMLRRDMVGLRLIRRNRDGSDYRRVEQKPPLELPLLLRTLGGRD